MAVVADGASYLHRSEDRVYDKRPDDVSRQVGRLRSVGKFISLADLERAKKIDGATEQRRQVFQCPNIACLEQKVLVGEQLIRTKRHKTCSATKLKRWNPGLVAVAGSTIRIHENRRRIAQAEEVLELQLRQWKALRSRGISIEVLGEELRALAGAGHNGLIQPVEGILQLDVAGRSRNCRQSSVVSNLGREVLIATFIAKAKLTGPSEDVA